MDVLVFDDRPVLLVFLVQHFGVFEVLNELVKSLETGVGECTDLNRRTFTFSLLYFFQW